VSDFSGVDWQTARYDDAEFVPGDPYEVARLGKKLKDTAKLIQQQAGRLRNLVDGNGWDSDAGREFTKKVHDTVDLLGKSHQRYAAAGTALGSSVGEHDTDWASALHAAQQRANSQITKAREADHESRQYQHHLDHLPKGHHDSAHDSGAHRLHQQKNQADDDLGNAIKALRAVLDHRDTMADKAATAIRDAIDHDGLKDPKHHWWDTAADWIAKIGHWAGVAAAILGVLALVLSWVPVLGEVLGALALIASVVALVCDTVSALDGRGTWLDVAIDAIGVLSFGAGRLLGTTAKEAVLAARGSRALTEAAAMEKAAGGMDEAFEIVGSVFGKMSGPEAARAIEYGPTRLLPRFTDVVKDSVNPKLYLDDIKGAVKGWPGLKAAVDPSRIFEDAGALKGVVGTKFTTMAYAGKALFIGSQTLPLAAGWANLAPVSPGETAATGPDIVGGVLHLKDIPGVGASGIPFYNWRWSEAAAG
jgi:hypothetical protein